MCVLCLTDTCAARAGLIEKSALDGQRTYHSELDAAIRRYIQEHQSEFIPEGVDPAAVLPVTLDVAHGDDGVPAPAPPPVPLPLSDLERERERNRRGLQWALDTFVGASQVAKRSASGAIELTKDAWDQSTSTTVLYFVIVLLVISNAWTLLRMGRREEVGRRKQWRQMKMLDEREKWVHDVVKGLWEEMAGKVPPPPTELPIPFSTQPVTLLPGRSEPVPVDVGLREEISGMQQTLDVVEERVRCIRESLASLN